MPSELTFSYDIPVVSPCGFSTDQCFDNDDNYFKYVGDFDPLDNFVISTETNYSYKEPIDDKFELNFQNNFGFSNILTKSKFIFIFCRHLIKRDGLF